MKLFGKSLLIVSCAVWSAQGAATQFYGVEIGKRFVQTSSAAPVVPATQGYAGRAFVYASAPTAGSVKKPNAANAVNMTLAGDHIETLGVYDFPQQLNSAWPPNNYTVNINNAADGAKSAVMNLANDFYPAAPRISNFDAAQAIMPTQAFTITWDSLGLAAKEFVYAQIIRENGDVAYETAKIPGLAGALNGLSTSLTIPANVLPEGKEFTFRLTSWFGITRNTTVIPGAQGLTAYTARTALTIRTRWITQDVLSYGVEKRVHYEQDAGAPGVRANGFEMTAFAAGALADSVKGAAFTPPGGAARNMVAAGANFSFTQAFASQALLDGAFGHGNYFMAITTKNNGLRTNTLSLAANTYPNAAQVTNINEAQWVRPGAAFTLNWTVADGKATDLAQLAIMEGTNVVLTTPAVVGTAGALNGAHTSFVIPAGALAAGKIYSGMLRVSRPAMVDAATYPAARGVWSYARVTWFPIKTASGPTPQPLLARPLRVNDQTELTFSSVRGERYILQAAQEFPNWSTLQNVTGAGAATIYRLPASNLGFRFYRVAIAP